MIGFEQSSTQNRGLGSIFSSDDPLGVLLGNYKVFGFGGLLLVGGYVAQMILFTLLGVGWTWGSARVSSGLNFFVSQRYSPSATLGAHMVHLNPDQKLNIHYDTQIDTGCLIIQVRQIPNLETVDGGRLEFDRSGAGDVSVTPPTSGWYEVSPAIESVGCKNWSRNANRAEWRKIADGSYQVSWRAGS